MTEAAVELEDVSLALGQGASRVQVLKGIDVSIMRGETTGIVGPSGSGKSTLLMVIAGLEGVDKGTVRIAGEVLNGRTEDDIARFRGRNVGIVFQSFHLIPNMTALENVAVPLELAGAPDAFAVAARELEAVAWSRLPVGSSAMRIAGLGASARAMATRCCSPPESWPG